MGQWRPLVNHTIVTVDQWHLISTSLGAPLVQDAAKSYRQLCSMKTGPTKNDDDDDVDNNDI